MLIATEIIQTVHKYSNMTALHGGGEVFRFVLSFVNRSHFFVQDFSNKFNSFPAPTRNCRSQCSNRFIFLHLFISKPQNQAVSLMEPIVFYS